MNTVLVIGATGKTGRHVVDGLLERGADVRALVRNPRNAGLPEEVTIVEGAIEDSTALATAAADADTAFLLWPGFDPSAVEEVVTTLTANLGRIVYLSAANLQHGRSGVMDGIYAEVEAALAASGVAWTFLRAGGFAANTLGWAGQIQAGDVVRIPFPDAARPLVDDRDLAEAAVRALLDPRLAGRTFDLTGSETLTQHRQVADIGSAIGRELRVEEQPPEEAKEELAAAMGAKFATHALAHWATLVDDPEEVRDGVEQLLGRPPRPFSEWARDHADDFAGRGAA